MYSRRSASSREPAIACGRSAKSAAICAGGLEVALGVDRQPPARFRDRRLVADAGQDVVERPVCRLGEADAVRCRRRAHETPPRGRADRWLSASSSRRRWRWSSTCTARGRRCRRADRPALRRHADRAASASRPMSATSPPVWPSRSSSRSEPAALRRRELHARDQPAEIPVAVARAPRGREASSRVGLRAGASQAKLSPRPMVSSAPMMALIPAFFAAR